MAGWIKYMVAGFGLPFVAQQLHDQTQDISERLIFVNFISDNRREVIRLTGVGLFGIVLVGSGLSLTLFSIAQRIDFHFEAQMSASMLVAFGILIIGLSMSFYVWRCAISLEKKYTNQLRLNHGPASFLKTIISSIFRSFLGAPLGVLNQSKSYNSSLNS